MRFGLIPFQGLQGQSRPSTHHVRPFPLDASFLQQGWMVSNVHVQARAPVSRVQVYLT